MEGKKGKYYYNINSCGLLSMLYNIVFYYYNKD